MPKQDNIQRLKKGAPPLTDSELAEVNALYPAYLFRRRRTREIWTTCCGRHETVPEQEYSDALAAVMEAKHQGEIREYGPFSCHCGYISAPPPQVQEKVCCPFCGREAVVKELGRTGKRDNLAAWRRVLVLRFYRGALWATAYDTCKRYGDPELLTALPGYTLETVYRFVPGKTEMATVGYYTYYRVMDRRPEKLPIPITEPFRWNSDEGMGYAVIGTVEIGKSPFRWCGFTEFMKYSISAARFLAVCTRYPRQVEMLMKAGLHWAVADLVEGRKWNGKAFDWEESDPQKAFGLDKQELKAFLAGSKDLNCLGWYKRFRRAGTPCTFAELDGLCGELGVVMFQRVVAKLARYQMGIPKWRRYIEREQKAAQGRKKTEPPVHDVAGWWNDYIDAAQVLGLDLKNPVFLTPKKLLKKHDAATAAASAIVEGRRRDEAKQMELRRLKKLAPRYTYSDGRWLIRPPLGAEEIVAEGKALKHCVGGYADRHVKGKVTILFLRDREKPGKPLVTIEMDGDRLIQIHGWDDERTACKANPKRVPPRELYAGFLEPWLAWVKAGSRRDKKGRPILPKKCRQTKEEVHAA